MQWFGLANHMLVYSAFVASVIALHLAVARFMSGLGMPWSISLAAGGLITYLGLGFQVMLVQSLFGWTLCGAVVFLAADVVVRNRRPARRMPLLVATLLLFSMGCDSSLALLGCVFVGLLAVRLWPIRHALAAMAVPVLFHLVWLVAGRASDAMPHATFAKPRVSAFNSCSRERKPRGE